MATAATNPEAAGPRTDRAHIRRAGLRRRHPDYTPCSIRWTAPSPTRPIEDEDDQRRREARHRRVQAPGSSDHEHVIPNEEVLAEFGLTAEDFERMGQYTARS